MLSRISLMTISLVAAATSVAAATTPKPYIDYPGFLDRKATVEVVIDRGLMQELIVKCGQGTAIISYSKVEKLYCGPSGGCAGNLQPIVQRTCK